MADLEKRVGSLEQQVERIYTILDVLATNQNKLDEALATLTDAQIKTQEQFRDTDRRIADLVSGIGEFIRKMDQRQN